MKNQNAPSQQLRSLALDALLFKGSVLTDIARFKESLVYYVEGNQQAKEFGSLERQSKSYLGLSSIKCVQGNYADAMIDANEALRIATLANSVIHRVRAMRMIARSYVHLGKYDEGTSWHQQAMDEAIAIGDQTGLANALTGLASIAADREEVVLALDYHKKALAIHRAGNSKSEIAGALVNVAAFLGRAGNPAEAMACLDEALVLSQSAGALREESYILHNIGIVHRRQNRNEESLMYLKRGLAIREQVGDRLGVVYSHGALADVYKNLMWIDQAIAASMDALRLADELNDPFATSHARISLAFTYLELRRYTEALPLCLLACRTLGELRVPDGQAHAAYGTALCTHMLEVADAHSSDCTISQSDFRSKARAFISDNEFNAEAFDRVSVEWMDTASEYGLTLTG